MARNAVLINHLGFALDQRFQIRDQLRHHVVAFRIDPFRRNGFLRVGGIADWHIGQFDPVRLVTDPADRRHPSAFSIQRTLAGFPSQHLRFADIGGAGNMRRTSLHQIQLNGAHLAADPVTYQLLQDSCRAGNVAVTEIVHRSALCLLRKVTSLSVFHSPR